VTSQGHVPGGQKTVVAFSQNLVLNGFAQRFAPSQSKKGSTRLKNVLVK
jgi:hypothetical protein